MNVQVSDRLRRPTSNIQHPIKGWHPIGKRLRCQPTVFSATPMAAGASNGIKSTLDVERWTLNVGVYRLPGRSSVYMFSLLIGILWILFCGMAVAQEPPAMPDAAAAVQNPPVQTGPEAETDVSAMTDIHDIKSLVAVPVPVSPAVIAMWAAVLLLVAGALLGGWYLWKKRRKSPVAEIEAILSPEDAALSQLEALSPDTEDGKIFYFRLSAILRQYLEGRFGIDGLEMTTEELLPHVEAMTLARDLKRDMIRFLVSSDPVKFAGAPTHRERMETDLGFVRGIVEKTAASLDVPKEAPDNARRASE